MNLPRTLKYLIVGETWTLPMGIATVVLVSALVVRPLLDPGAWHQAGCFILLAGVAAVLLLRVSSSTGRRR